MNSQNISFKNSTTKASIFVIGGKLMIRAMDIIVLMVLTRILTPADFGIIAMAKTAVIILEAITELPIASALVRQDKLTDAMFNTALTLGILRGLIISIFILVISMPLASFYHEPRVALLMIAMSFGPLFRGIASPKIVFFMKQMDFKKQILQESLGKLVALILSITYVLIYKDYWALVIMMVSTPALTSIFSFIIFPMRYKPSLSEWIIFKDIIGWNFLSQTITAINWHLEKLLLPVYIDRKKFGFYSIYGDLISMTYQTVVVPISGPISVSFQKAKLENNLSQTYNLTLNVAFTLIAPSYGFIACFPENTILIFFGKNWHEYSYVLKYLAIIAIISIPSMLIAPLSNILYQNKALTMRVIIEFIVSLPTTLIAVIYYGINGALLSRLISCCVVVWVSISMTKKYISNGFIAHFGQLLRPLLALIITHLSLTYLKFNIINYIVDSSLIMQFIISIILYLLVYMFSLIFLWLLFGKKYGFEQALINRFFIKNN